MKWSIRHLVLLTWLLEIRHTSTLLFSPSRSSTFLKPFEYALVYTLTVPPSPSHADFGPIFSAVGEALKVRDDEERSDSSMPPTTITNNLLLVATLLTPR